jgi:cation-transporting ATPase 13A3/4/5
VNGDPLEVELLNASGWTLSKSANASSLMDVIPANSKEKYSMLKHFEFSADKLRAGTILKRPNGEVVYLLKGSPEKIISISGIYTSELLPRFMLTVAFTYVHLEPSTVPEKITESLSSLAKSGLRVIGFAYKVFPSAMTPEEITTSLQENIESSGLRFIGLVYLSSSLKKDTKSTNSTLQSASIYTKMITGDHIFTAIAVAIDCGLMIKPKATKTILNVTPPSSPNEKQSIVSSRGSGSGSESASESTVFIIDESKIDGKVVIMDFRYVIYIYISLKV